MSRSRKKRRPSKLAASPETSAAGDKGSKAAAPRRGFLAGRPMLRFVLLFGILWGAFELFFFGLVLGSGPFDTYLAWNAGIAGALIRFFGQEAGVSGQALSGSNFVMEIRHGCDALQPLGLFLATVLAFPAAFRSKVPGVLAGVVLLLTINMVRILTLFYTGIYFPRVFEIMHADVWQPVFIFLALLFWLIWARWATRDRSPRSDVAG